MNWQVETVLHCIFHDISLIKTVENALTQSETQYRQLVELAQEGIWAFNRDFTTVFVNPRMAKMLGYAESEMVGKIVFDFLDEEAAEQAKKFFTKSKPIIDGKFEFHFRRKDGTRIDTSITARDT